MLKQLELQLSYTRIITFCSTRGRFIRTALLLFLCCTAPGSQETYMLYKDVCAIPTTVTRRVELVNVSRAVCRFACSETYEAECSGFLFSRRERRCTLSPYTGELRPNGTVVCDLTSGLEFYRRTRILSRLLHFVCSVTALIVYRGTKIINNSEQL